ncbi:4-alpha-glucanotransferase [Thalassotalea sp. ND16A]|uniref:4-alpha-glucanotransferase n=1 Tax=Thalassotalea sp. ND16A TaxID=1535422 RepID=UPI00051CCCA4|nr:4-alpha-glucanotransferase [Thalassotalea sp. ND16A]KGJ99666.1 4-alpha-glucanotransferase [Thalassotalea sp. ND16A]
MSLVQQLAEQVGFYSSYTGTFGDQVVAKEQAQRALLTAMGYQLDEGSLVKSVNDLDKSPWRNMLPAVHIAKLEQQQHFIKISLPKTAADILTWQIITELDVEMTGSFHLTDLQLFDEIQLDDVQYCQYQLPLPALAPGYHQLTISSGGNTANCPLIFAPKTCYSHQQASENKIWGYTAQLYSLRSETNWGIGDFTDLNSLIEKSAEQGASAIGINPLHPLYQNNPAHRSPYSPSSRCFLNPLYIDVTAIANFAQCEKAQTLVNSVAFGDKITQAKQSELVDYPAVAEIKYQVIDLLFEDFCHTSATLYATEAEEFAQFKQQQGQDLFRFATFDALYEHFRAIDEGAYGWTHWPKAYQQPHSEKVLAFQRTHAHRIEYFCFVQWLAHRQLNAVKQTAQAKNMPIGLYLDLAVGCDGSGAEVWSDQALYVAGASIGAPPDGMNPLGQGWGLTPLNPVELQKQGYQPLVKALRCSMQYAGALRIDHILGLMRQYWIAPGMQADEGVYITFPLADILSVIALESVRNNCVVIGEDLGNVPDGFSQTMQDSGLLSFKVLFFERWQTGLFKRPEEFPVQSMVTVSTHDTATLSGWWQGRDLQWRQTLNLYPNEEAGDQDRNSRSGDRQMLIAALDDLNVIDMAKAPQQDPAVMNTELSIAVQKYLATAPSHLQLIPLEDAIESQEQVNIPGTIDQHPNWLQKLPVTLENFWHTNSVRQIAQAMNKARPK